MSRSGHSFAQENIGHKDEGSSDTDVIVYVRHVAAAGAAKAPPPIDRHPQVPRWQGQKKQASTYNEAG
ncbi:hypothetical protein PG988_005261 [Apiospora saccharicola]